MVTTHLSFKMHSNFQIFATLVFCAVLAGVVQKCTADTSLSGCPHVTPVPDLTMKNILGIWYVIQKTSGSDSCLVYNITKDTEHVGGQYLLTEIEQHKSLLTSLYHEHKSTAKLTVPDSNEPGVMDVHVPFTIGTSKLTVFMTDYDHYLAMFTCKPYLRLMHSWSVEILSRTPDLNMDYVDIIRTRLSSNNVDPFALSFVSQKDCAPIGTQGSVIKAATNIINNIEDEITILVDDKGEQAAGKIDEVVTVIPKVSSSSPK